jgi:pimeloyl-ACP methyl ester carboxylesterase
MSPVKYQTANVGIKIFYREAGAPSAPKLLLLHGSPTASHMFRDLIPLLADRFHIVALDLPGFGKSDMPGDRRTFDRMAEVICRFTEIIGFDRYAVYVFDYGAPTGFWLAVKHPDRITSIISQNGNAYEEGLSDGWDPIRAYWQDPSTANRGALRGFLTPETTIWQYTHVWRQLFLSSCCLTEKCYPTASCGMLPNLFRLQRQTNLILAPVRRRSRRAVSPALGAGASHDTRGFWPH